MPDTKIDLRLSRVQQVFNSLDPTPFPEKDLDDDAVALIVGRAEEFPAVRRRVRLYDRLGRMPVALRFGSRPAA